MGPGVGLGVAGGVGLGVPGGVDPPVVGFGVGLGVPGGVGLGVGLEHFLFIHFNSSPQQSFSSSQLSVFF